MISAPDNEFDDWKADVDRVMTRRFLIDTASAGLDEARLQEFFESGQSASDFVEWYGEKYDLVEYTMADFMPRSIV